MLSKISKLGSEFNARLKYSERNINKASKIKRIIFLLNLGRVTICLIKKYIFCILRMATKTYKLVNLEPKIIVLNKIYLCSNYIDVIEKYLNEYIY